MLQDRLEGYDFVLRLATQWVTLLIKLMDVKMRVQLFSTELFTAYTIQHLDSFFFNNKIFQTALLDSSWEKDKQNIQEGKKIQGFEATSFRSLALPQHSADFWFFTLGVSIPLFFSTPWTLQAS